MSGFEKFLPYRLYQAFFSRPTLTVARDLLGKVLVSKRNGVLQAGLILETEAYVGTADLASHARFGKTRRNLIMWGPPGRIYVYLIYGIYHLVNIITEPEEYPAAALLRSVKIIDPDLVDQMVSKTNIKQKEKYQRTINALKSSFFKASNAPALARLKKDNEKRHVLSPAKITQYFGLTRADTGLNLTSSNEFFIVDLGIRPKKIIRTPRIGIKYAGPIWSQKKWRFVAEF